MIRTLAHDDVIFVCPSADPSAYAKYGASLIASGGIHSSDYVSKLKRQGISTTGTMWCLTAGSHASLPGAPGDREGQRDP